MPMPPNSRSTRSCSAAALTMSRPSSTMSVIVTSAAHELVADHPAVAEHDQAAREHALRVLRARVHAQRPADRLGRLRLVDVAVQAAQRLRALDPRAHGGG